MLYYFVLCFISLFAGKGILSIFRVNLTQSLSFLISPVVTFLFWSLLLSLGIYFHNTISELCFSTYFLTFVFCGVGLFQCYIDFQKNKNRLIEYKNEFVLFSFIFLSPIILMFPYFFYGITHFSGSPLPDKFFYMAMGEYLWHYPRGLAGHLLPLYQIGSVDAQNRFTSGAILAFLSPMLGHPGNTQLPSNLLLSWNFFLLASASAFFAKTIFNSKECCLYILFTMLSAVLFLPLLGNHFDNLLILSIFPALIGFIYTLKYRDYRLIFLVAVLLATMIIAYVEMAPFVIIGVTIILYHRIAVQEKNLKYFFVFSGLTTTLILFLVLPDLQHIAQYFLGQLQAALGPHMGQRNGDGRYLAQLELHPMQMLLSIFGLKFFILFCVACLIALFFGLYGMIVLWKKKHIGFLSALIFLLVAILYMFSIRYFYAIYKIILLDWWMLSFVLITGTIYISNKYINFKNQSIKILLAVLGILWLSMNLGASWYFLKKTQIHALRSKITNGNFFLDPLYDTTRLRNIIADKKIEVQMSGISPSIAIWSVYILRDKNVHFAKQFFFCRNLMYRPVFLTARTISAKHIDYIFSDNSSLLSKSHLVWSNGFYFLWKN